MSAFKVGAGGSGTGSTAPAACTARVARAAGEQAVALALTPAPLCTAHPRGCSQAATQALYANLVKSAARPQSEFVPSTDEEEITASCAPDRATHFLSALLSPPDEVLHFSTWTTACASPAHHQPRRYDVGAPDFAAQLTGQPRPSSSLSAISARMRAGPPHPASLTAHLRCALLLLQSACWLHLAGFRQH